MLMLTARFIEITFQQKGIFPIICVFSDGGVLFATLPQYTPNPPKRRISSAPWRFLLQPTSSNKACASD
jgi:hypothetical protein